MEKKVKKIERPDFKPSELLSRYTTNLEMYCDQLEEERDELKERKQEWKDESDRWYKDFNESQAELTTLKKEFAELILVSAGEGKELQALKDAVGEFLKDKHKPLSKRELKELVKLFVMYNFPLKSRIK